MDRETLILRDAGRNRGQVRALLEERYFNSGSSDRVLQRLIEQGRLNVLKNAIPGGLSWYQLTEAEARRQGMPEPSPPKQRTVLRKNLAIVWCTTTAATDRIRLVPAECRRLSGDDSLIAPHIAERNGEASAVYRVYVPEPSAQDEPFLNSVRQHAFKALDHPQLVEWLRRDTYRFLVLVHSETRARDLERLVERREFPTVTLRFEVVPSFEQFHEALTGRFALPAEHS